MTKHPNLRQDRVSGFSLVELLVVLTIIGILTSILLPVGSQVMKLMRKTEAQKTATELRTAVMNYYSEYKRYPPVSTGSGGGDVTVDTSGSNGLIAGLLAAPDSNYTDTINRRRILFFSSRKAKRPGMAGIYKEGSGYALYDPFFDPNRSENYYHVVFDANYDNVIQVADRSGSGTEDLFAGAAVWSYGPNGKAGSDKGKNDDIYAY